MQAQQLRHRRAPAFERTADLFSDIVGAFVWAQRMRRGCRDWERAGRRLDGNALRRIAAGLQRETR